MADATARIFLVARPPRHNVPVKMRNRLAGCRTIVDTVVKSIWRPVIDLLKQRLSLSDICERLITDELPESSNTLPIDPFL